VSRFELEVRSQGFIVAPSGGTRSAVPALVPWSALGSVSADEAVDTRDGPRGQVLRIEVADGQWLGTGTVRKFVVPALQVRPLLAAISAGHEADRRTTVNPSSRFSGVLALGGIWSPARWRARDGGRTEGGPYHDPGRRRVVPIVVGLLAMALVAGSTSSSFVSSAGSAPRVHLATEVTNSGNSSQALSHRSADLAPATSKPAPAPPSLAGSPPLHSHEIFGYAPYWTLPQSSGFDVNDLTTLAYFSVDANADGSLDESGAGWNGYESQDLVNLVTRSHAAGDRVVLTVTCFSQHSLDAITSDPTAASRLSSTLISAVSAKNLDGVNFDFEGQGSADRKGLTALITHVSQALHAANPHWQVSMATYASAASDSAGFYDVAALAPALDGFFVMAYDMNDRTTPSATSPLVGGGYNATETLQQFTAVVPPKKVILGIPYYGYDWPTTDGTRAALSTGGETPLIDGVIAASGHQTYWDPSTQTPWTSYQVGTQWHETFFDNPTSLALKAQLADRFHVAGMGIWALGMDGNSPAMLAALLGKAPAAKDYQTGPTALLPSSSTATAPAAPPDTGYITKGTWKGVSVSFTPVPTPRAGGERFVGTLSALTTTDPALACLQSGPPLDVWTFRSLPGVDVVIATQPLDCADAVWTFRSPPTSGSKPAPTTTTTRPPSTTTTTTTRPPTTTTTTTSTTSTTTTTTLPGG
jgi:hypothetical protein